MHTGFRPRTLIASLCAEGLRGTEGAPETVLAERKAKIASEVRKFARMA